MSKRKMTRRTSVLRVFLALKKGEGTKRKARRFVSSPFRGQIPSPAEKPFCVDLQNDLRYSFGVIWTTCLNSLVK